MGEDWERLLDGALEKKRARAKAVKFTEFDTGPGEAEGPPDEGSSPPGRDDEREHLREQMRLLGQKVRELIEENTRLRSRLEGDARGGEEIERLKKELARARAVIRSVEEAYKIGRRRSRR